MKPSVILRTEPGRVWLIPDDQTLMIRVVKNSSCSPPNDPGCQEQLNEYLDRMKGVGVGK